MEEQLSEINYPVTVVWKEMKNSNEGNQKLLKILL